LNTFVCSIFGAALHGVKSQRKRAETQSADTPSHACKEK